MFGRVADFIYISVVIRPLKFVFCTFHFVVVRVILVYGLVSNIWKLLLLLLYVNRPRNRQTQCTIHLFGLPCKERFTIVQRINEIHKNIIIIIINLSDYKFRHTKSNLWKRIINQKYVECFHSLPCVVYFDHKLCSSCKKLLCKDRPKAVL